jgi:D-alanyl-D-alanine carboxypeptidase
MDRHRARPAAVLALTVLAVTAAVGLTGATGRAGASTPCTSQCSALQDAARALVAAPDGPPGVLIVVHRPGTVVVHSAGTSQVGESTPITTTDHLRLASVSKAYSGAVALSLVGSGVLRLSDTVGRWLPGLPAAWNRVTLAQLLQHTSGIKDFSQTQEFVDAISDSLQVAPPPAVLPTYAYGYPNNFTPPGSAYQYSNTDNILVALMVQAATGHTYEQELTSLVLQPLGLDQTSLPSGSALPTPYAHGYGLAAGETPVDQTHEFAAGWSWASGGIVATPLDADRFIRAYARGATTTKAVDAEQFRFRPGSSEPAGPGTNSAGLAIFRYATRCGTVYGHTGNTAGYTQFAAATRDGTRSVVVQVNAQVSERTAPALLAELRDVETLAVCAALAP